MGRVNVLIYVATDFDYNMLPSCQGKRTNHCDSCKHKPLYEGTEQVSILRCFKMSASEMKSDSKLISSGERVPANRDVVEEGGAGLES